MLDFLSKFIKIHFRAKAIESSLPRTCSGGEEGPDTCSGEKIFSLLGATLRVTPGHRKVRGANRDGFDRKVKPSPPPGNIWGEKGESSDKANRYVILSEKPTKRLSFLPKAGVKRLNPCGVQFLPPDVYLGGGSLSQGETLGPDK